MEWTSNTNRLLVDAMAAVCVKSCLSSRKCGNDTAWQAWVLPKPIWWMADIQTSFHYSSSQQSSLAHGTLSPDTDRDLNRKRINIWADHVLLVIPPGSPASETAEGVPDTIVLGQQSGGVWWTSASLPGVAPAMSVTGPGECRGLPNQDVQ